MYATSTQTWELELVDRDLMEWRTIKWSAATEFSQHFQVIRVNKCALTSKEGPFEWTIAQKPSRVLCIGDSVFVWLANDAQERGYEEAFTIVGESETRPESSDRRLHMMSSAGLHAPITLNVPFEWVGGAIERPQKAKHALAEMLKRKGADRAGAHKSS